MQIYCIKFGRFSNNNIRDLFSFHQCDSNKGTLVNAMHVSRAIKDDDVYVKLIFIKYEVIAI